MPRFYAKTRIFIASNFRSEANSRDFKSGICNTTSKRTRCGPNLNLTSLCISVSARTKFSLHSVFQRCVAYARLKFTTVCTASDVTFKGLIGGFRPRLSRIWTRKISSMNDCRSTCRCSWTRMLEIFEKNRPDNAVNFRALTEKQYNLSVFVNVLRAVSFAHTSLSLKSTI